MNTQKSNSETRRIGASIPADLFVSARAIAAARRISVSALVASALEKEIAKIDGEYRRLAQRRAEANQ